MSLKKILKMFLPHGIIVMHRKYIDYKKKYKNKGFVFDVIFSVGSDCKPAYYLQKYGLRFYANPLDWMTDYSLDTVVHLYQTKFNDFFTDYVEDKQKSHQFIDIKNNIISIHYEDIGNNNRAFREKMKNRFGKMNKRLLRANKICFISSRNEDIENFSNFLKEIGSIYSGKITYINIRNNEERDGIFLPFKHVKEKISKKLELIEYEFNDVHPDGKDKNDNPHAWIGNFYLWDSIMKRFSIKMNFFSYLLMSDVQSTKRETVKIQN